MTDKTKQFDPVDQGHCVFCKGNLEETEFKIFEISTGEKICKPCLQDCRDFKRASATTLMIASDYVTDDAAKRINKAYREAANKEAEKGNVEAKNPKGHRSTKRNTEENEVELNEN